MTRYWRALCSIPKSRIGRDSSGFPFFGWNRRYTASSLPLHGSSDCAIGNRHFSFGRRCGLSWL